MIESESKVPVDTCLEQVKVLGCGKHGGWRQEENSSLEVIRINELGDLYSNYVEFCKIDKFQNCLVYFI